MPQLRPDLKSNDSHNQKLVDPKTLFSSSSASASTRLHIHNQSPHISSSLRSSAAQHPEPSHIPASPSHTPHTISSYISSKTSRAHPRAAAKPFPPKALAKKTYGHSRTYKDSPPLCALSWDASRSVFHIERFSRRATTLCSWISSGGHPPSRHVFFVKRSRFC